MENYCIDAKTFIEASYFELLIRKTLACVVDKKNANYRITYSYTPNERRRDLYYQDVTASCAEELIEKGLGLIKWANVCIKDITCLEENVPKGKVNVLRVNVYKAEREDCTNGGISSRNRYLLMYHPEGPFEVDLNDIPDNFVILERRTLFGERESDFIRPFADVPPEMVGWMSGGNIAYTSDSRFHWHPLLIHDRAEKLL